MSTPFESDIHKAIAEYLGLVCRGPGGLRFVWAHCPNGEIRNKRTAANLKKMGVRPGFWDFVIFGCNDNNGFCYCEPFFLEVKRPTPTGERRQPIESKLSDVQVQFQEDMMSVGCCHAQFAVVDSVVGAAQAIQKWGLI